MPIFYALIARNGHILTEATSRTVEAGNFQQIALQILSKLDGREADGTKRSFSTGGYCLLLSFFGHLVVRFHCLNCSYIFNIQVEDGTIYLCLVNMGTCTSYPFLQRERNCLPLKSLHVNTLSLHFQNFKCACPTRFWRTSSIALRQHFLDRYHLFLTPSS